MLHLKSFFEELHIEWFSNKQFWFEKKEENDKYLSEKYFHFIRNITEYKNELVDQSINCQIGAIIAFDQIPRHYNRIVSINCDKYSLVAAKISSNLNFNLGNSLDLYINISAYEWCFIMLPFRHLYKSAKIDKILEFMLDKYNNINTSITDRQIYKKFIYQTVLKIHEYNTKLSIENQILNFENIGDSHNLNISFQWNSYNTILSFCPSNPLQLDQTICPSILQITETFHKEIDLISKQTKPNIIVSISGGVDSCVCLFLLSMLYPKNKILAAHVNYNNRKENTLELEFVKHFCKILGIKLFYRKITEITRHPCRSGLRDMYESVTKEIRFGLYQHVSQIFSEISETYVMLGHNKDDCFENILTNIAMKNNYNNLNGVERLTKVKGIHLWRPLIDVSKQQIIDFAKFKNIPFLNDSTPKWSKRGKIRDVVVPALKHINEDIVNSFFALKNKLQSNDSLIDSYILPNILSKFKCDESSESDEKIIIGVFDEKELICHHEIWSKVLSCDPFKNMIGKSLCSFKSIEQFVEFLERFLSNMENMRIKNIFNTKTKFVLKNNIIVSIHRTKLNQIELAFKKLS
jgi:tRNA(Ile)-lysidine synthetase-like protein